MDGELFVRGRRCFLKADEGEEFAGTPGFAACALRARLAGAMIPDRMAATPAGDCVDRVGDGSKWMHDGSIIGYPFGRRCDPGHQNEVFANA